MTGQAIAVCASLLLFGTTSTYSQGRTYNIVPTESSVWIFVGKAGLLSSLGHAHEVGVPSVTGQVVVPEGEASGGSLALNVDATSLTVLDKNVSAKDRTEIFKAMHNEVLESAQYQKITFISVTVSDMQQTGTGHYSFTLHGDLTLHGVTKRIAVPVTATVTPSQLRATGTYTLKQTDYGIKPYAVAGGTIKVQNDVVVNFNLVAQAAP
jgi:polyisoprenoid-binding protein YceI